MERMDPNLVKQWRRGFAEAEEVIENEKRVQLPRMSVAESLEIFNRLYASWRLIQQQPGGGDPALEIIRLQETLDLRARLNKAGDLKPDL